MTGIGIGVMSLVLGLAAGVLSGMFGIGGGLVIVPALMFLFGDPPKTAVGTSLFALLWPVGLLGVREYWRAEQLRVAQGIWIAAGLFAGAYFGARITLAISDVNMKRFYAAFLLIVGVYLLYSTREAPKSAAPRPAEAGGR